MDFFAFQGQPWRTYTVDTAGNHRFDAYDLPRSFPVVHYRAPASPPFPVVPVFGPWAPYPPFLASQRHPDARPPTAALPDDILLALFLGKSRRAVHPSTRVYRTLIHGSPPDDLYIYAKRSRQSHSDRELQYAVSFFERPTTGLGPRGDRQRLLHILGRWQRAVRGVIILVALVLLGVIKNRALRRRITNILRKLGRFLLRFLPRWPRQSPTRLIALPAARGDDDEDEGSGQDGGQRGLPRVEDVSSSHSEGTTDFEGSETPSRKQHRTEHQPGVHTHEVDAARHGTRKEQSTEVGPAIVVWSADEGDAFHSASQRNPKPLSAEPERQTEPPRCMTAPGSLYAAASAGQQHDGAGNEESETVGARGRDRSNGRVRSHPRSLFERFADCFSSTAGQATGQEATNRGCLGWERRAGPGGGSKGSIGGKQKSLSTSASLHEALCELSAMMQVSSSSSESPEFGNSSLPHCFEFPSLASGVPSPTALDTPTFACEANSGMDDEERVSRLRHSRALCTSDSLPSFPSYYRNRDDTPHWFKRRRSLERFPRALTRRTPGFGSDGREDRGGALRWVVPPSGKEKDVGRTGSRLPASERAPQDAPEGQTRAFFASKPGQPHPGDAPAGAASASTSFSPRSQSAASKLSTCACESSLSSASSSTPAVSTTKSSSSPGGVPRPSPTMVSVSFLPAHLREHQHRLHSLLSSRVPRSFISVLRRLWTLLRRVLLFEEGDAEADASAPQGQAGREQGDTEDARQDGEILNSQGSLKALSSLEMEAKVKEIPLIQQFLRLLRLAFPKEKIWSSEGLYLLTLLATLISRTFLSIWIASVNGKVVEGIVRQDGKKFMRGLSLLVAYAVPAALVNATIQYSEKVLGVLLRRNLTNAFVTKYLKGLTFYRMVALDARVSHPDEILSTTTASFSMLVASLFSSFLKPTVDIIFLTRSILRHLGVKAPLCLGFWYLLTAGVLHWMSPPIGKKTARLHELEAKYRALHSDLLQHSEEIAFYGGGKPASLRLQCAFDSVCLYRQHMFFIFHLTMGTLDMLFAKHMSVVMGYLVVALPAFKDEIRALFALSGRQRHALLDMTDYSKLFKDQERAKQMRQTQFDEEIRKRGLLARLPDTRNGKEDIAHAYVRNSTLLINVAKAVGRMVLAYKEVQQLGGYTERLYEFLQVVQDLQSGVYCPRVALPGETAVAETPHILASTGRLTIEKNAKTVEFHDVAVVTPGGHVLLQNVSFVIRMGKNVFLLGPNGCGKTSLFRILGGLWPLVEGEVRKPEASKLFYIPQRPYMPEGTLRDQVIYPMAYEDYQKLGGACNDSHLEFLLRAVGLGRLLDRFPEKWDTWRDWHEVLSGGEKQRMAFARLFFHRPVFAILDEATSAVSVDMEGALYRLCRKWRITLITISHNLSLLKYHDFLLRIFAARTDGDKSQGQRWAFEPTEGLRRLDSYSFLLNLAEEGAEKADKTQTAARHEDAEEEDPDNRGEVEEGRARGREREKTHADRKMRSGGDAGGRRRRRRRRDVHYSRHESHADAGEKDDAHLKNRREREDRYAKKEKERSRKENAANYHAGKGRRMSHGDHSLKNASSSPHKHHHILQPQASLLLGSSSSCFEPSARQLSSSPLAPLSGAHHHVRHVEEAPSRSPLSPSSSFSSSSVSSFSSLSRHSPRSLSEAESPTHAPAVEGFTPAPVRGDGDKGDSAGHVWGRRRSTRVESLTTKSDGISMRLADSGEEEGAIIVIQDPVSEVEEDMLGGVHSRDALLTPGCVAGLCVFAETSSSRPADDGSKLRQKGLASHRRHASFKSLDGDDNRSDPRISNSSAYSASSSLFSSPLSPPSPRLSDSSPEGAPPHAASLTSTLVLVSSPVLTSTPTRPEAGHLQLGQEARSGPHEVAQLDASSSQAPDLCGSSAKPVFAPFARAASPCVAPPSQVSVSLAPARFPDAASAGSLLFDAALGAPKRRHSGPAAARATLSAARIGAAAAEATVLSLKTAREKKQLEKESRQRQATEAGPATLR
ncbi:ABC transporter, ATP-binding domain-containing protein [Besnoitia besnoiti]|uniref:ABC transporter, ATP-binding domain-containing protein n=1 Tax=Besnoitia besnoiti TaxID=94643 RepID=A0A2A9MAZ1_BESBE|nr:ABC transporter, ATP-binding domain-containing protein [Besnoitia besnoiti]PFH34364.1 ABC transporter, ATP-binding domain-containing protein [Besnoitia besnoiti]